MKRSGLLGGFLAVAGAVMLGQAPVAQAQGGTIRCESQDGHFNQCRVPWRDAALVRQESKGACIRGESWGVDERGLWVDHGCRGLFAEAARGSRHDDRRGGDRDDRYGDRGRPDDDRGGWQPGPGWDRPIRLDCHSNQSRYQLCQVDVGRHGRVTLERQVSDAACREGYSWGWNRAGVWVAHGCRAQFLVDRRW